MKLLERYLVKNFFPAFIWCLFSFVTLYWIIDLFGHLDEILRNKIAFKLLIEFYLNLTPQILVQTIPVATLLASIYSLSNLSKHNEIIAMHSCGVSLWKIALPFLVTGLLIATFVLIINDRMVPPTLARAQVIKHTYIEKVPPKKMSEIENLTMYGSQNRLFYARSYNLKESKINDLVIIEHDEKLNPIRKVTAEIASWEYESWRLYNCIIYKLGPQGEVIGNPESHLEKTIDINETPDDFIKYRTSSESMNFATLYRYIRNFGGTSTKITRKLRVDLHSKVSFPLINLVMVIIAIPFSMASSRSGGAIRAIASSLGIALLFYTVVAFSVTLGKEGVLWPFWGAHLPNIIFATIGMVYFIRLRR